VWVAVGAGALVPVAKLEIGDVVVAGERVQATSPAATKQRRSAVFLKNFLTHGILNLPLEI
jgi:hypothetical protein